jgi:hypothetical protein
MNVFSVSHVAPGYREAKVNWKKIVTWVLIIFALYTIFARPDRAADIVENGFDLIAQAGDSVQQFFDALVA